MRSLSLLTILASTFLATLAALVVTKTAAPPERVTVVSQSPTLTTPNSGGAYPLSTSAKMMRLAQLQWGELTQREVDAITAAAKALPKASVTILCQNDDRCGAMALDFDNAFESAKWESAIDRPLIDKTKGIAASSKLLADLIDKATEGRIKPSVLPGSSTVNCTHMPPSPPPPGCGADAIPQHVLILGTKPRS